MHARRALRLLLVLVSGLALCAPPASARRHATRAETRAMWQAQDPGRRCVHRAGYVATVTTPATRAFRYGLIRISDARCGDGSVFLRKRSTWRRWVFVDAGSDWGSPQECARRPLVPLRIQRDLFHYPQLCAS